MGQVVHIVDATIASDKKQFFSRNTLGKTDLVVEMAAMSNGNAQVVHDISARAARGFVDLMIFYGHGAAGAQGMTGKDARGLRHGSGLSAETLGTDAAKAQWRSLRPVFSSNGGVILHGCNTGEGDKGEALMRDLARILGVPVYASDWYQRVGDRDLIGNVKMATPAGTISDDSGQGMRNLLRLGGLEAGMFIAIEGYQRVKQLF